MERIFTRRLARAGERQAGERAALPRSRLPSKGPQSTLGNQTMLRLLRTGSEALQREPEERRNAGETSTAPTKPQPVPDAATMRTITAIALAESDPARRSQQEVPVAWIYYNLWLAKGAAGFSASSAYLNKDSSGIFMIWMVALGDDTYAKVTGEQVKDIERQNAKIDRDNQKNNTKTPHVTDIASYVRHLGLARTAGRIQTQVAAALSTPAANPHPGWRGQGSRDDINLNKDHWPMIRQYIRLRLQDSALPPLFQVLPAGSVRSYTIIFDAEGIRAHFGKNPPKNVPNLSDQEVVEAAGLGGG